MVDEAAPADVRRAQTERPPYRGIEKPTACHPGAGGTPGEHAMGQYQTFIIRIWTDGSPGSGRGHIQHIASRRGKYFRDLERMVRFIQDFLGPDALPTRVDDGDPPAGPGPTDTAEPTPPTG